MRAQATRGLFHALGRVALLALVLLASGCEKTFRNMYDQPKYKPLAASSLWPDGRASRAPVAGTVARSEGRAAGTSSGRLGVTPVSPDVPLPTAPEVKAVAHADTAAGLVDRRRWTLPVIERGQERFDIYCAPCHSEAGDGDGMLPRRGFPHPPSFHIDRLRRAPDAHFYEVITHGYGVMYPYGDRVPPDDRRAIVAYIRALQLSQNAAVADLGAEGRKQLQVGP